MISILLIDDHARLRRTVRALLEASGLVAVVGEAQDVACGLRQALKLRPDLVVTDLNLPDDSGLALIEPLARLERPIPVLVLSLHTGPDYIERVRAAGAAGFVPKWHADEYLLHAITGVYLGQRYFEAPLFDRVETP